ncbi:Retrovirus-related Pol polyprotein from transposon RE1 [Vitis vinifera]|uniref:Retrovirus-related Pol polyprotein from transposon RE1 n=1 Tax=Vitis vinifera TaxID=29760 RepID=A0A438HK00_VITVI|nr:Retrovirus-related Pol polyprotein from transposon RE1 [Vitis vinifera]
MDVTFFENQLYLSQYSLQGENNVEQLLNQPSLPEQPPNLLPNPTVSPEQLLNQPSHPPEQPEHLLNQLVFEIDKPEQTNPTEPEVSTTKIDSRPRADSLQQPELRVYSMRSKLRIVETKMDQQCYQESKPIAIPEEMKALEKNRTWDFADKPNGKMPVGCKWVFVVKYKSDGSIESKSSLFLAANPDWQLEQLDIKNAFLNGDLEEEVYMELPHGFNHGRKEGKAQSDNNLFYRHNDGTVTILIAYVDDIIVTGNDPMEMERLKEKLVVEFETKDLGPLHYFLGMEVARNKSGIPVSQRKYILDLLKETGMLGCKPVDTPMDPLKKIGEQKESTPVDTGRYQRLVRKLIYLSHTRPNIAFAVSVVSQYMHAPCEEHMEAVYRIMKYLKGSLGKGLYFRKNETRSIEGFTNANWTGSIDDRRSTSSYCTFVWGNLVT